ncbi:PIG-L deacetylase family protein [Pseudoxanthomonas beigongshangi]|jgi:hypothetical protein
MHSDLPLVVVMAHPDDEFAVFPWLEAACRERRNVHCCWLTNGGWGGQDIDRRRAESTAVLRTIGVPPEAMHFIGERLEIPDGELHLRLDQVVPALRELLETLPEAIEVLVPAWEGGHQDHDATQLAAAAASHGGKARLRQFSLYHGAGLSGPWFRVLAPLAENGPSSGLPLGLFSRIKCIFRCTRYPSQWKSFLGLLPFYGLKMFARRPFVLQDVNFSRTAQRPHQGKLLYERRTALTWEAFAEQTSAYRSR